MGIDVDQVKQRIRWGWSLGDYSKLAAILEPASRELVDACAVSAGQEVLDVAAGTGNFAVLAAREGARVVASDLTPALIERGRERSAAEGLAVEWVEADAEDLPFEDGRFDCAASSFGAMFAPRPEVAARELIRVVRAGGTVGMANWTPESFPGQMFALSARYVPAEEGLPRPVDWGVEEIARARFTGLAASIELGRRQLPFEFESPEGAFAFFDENAGPQIAMRKVLDEDRYAAMRAEFIELVERFGRSADGPVAIQAEYLLVVARKAG